MQSVQNEDLRFDEQRRNALQDTLTTDNSEKHNHDTKESDAAPIDKRTDDEETAKMTLSPTVERFGPVIVVGSIMPKVGYGRLALATESFRCVDKVKNIFPMTLLVEEGLPIMNVFTDSDKNSFLNFKAPEMTCQVAVTLEKNPVEKPSTLNDWEAVIVQVVTKNEEVRSYGASKELESIDFTVNQYFQVDDRSYEAPILDVGELTCTCNVKDPAYCRTARQPFDIKVLMDDKLLFGKLSSRDRPESSARVSFYPQFEKDPQMHDFFKKYSNVLTADEYYLNEIEKESSIVTYLAIYNTTSREIYTPMAVQWFFNCRLRRVKKTDKFEWYETRSLQRPPIAWTESQPFNFPYITTHVLEQYKQRCSSDGSHVCTGYATFNNSVHFEAKLAKRHLH